VCRAPQSTEELRRDARAHPTSAQRHPIDFLAPHGETEIKLRLILNVVRLASWCFSPRSRSNKRLESAMEINHKISVPGQLPRRAIHEAQLGDFQQLESIGLKIRTVSITETGAEAIQIPRFAQRNTSNRCSPSTTIPHQHNTSVDLAQRTTSNHITTLSSKSTVDLYIVIKIGSIRVKFTILLQRRCLRHDSNMPPRLAKQNYSTHTSRRCYRWHRRRSHKTTRVFTNTTRVLTSATRHTTIQRLQVILQQ
jgi:hypothetical protein